MIVWFFGPSDWLVMLERFIFHLRYNKNILIEYSFENIVFTKCEVTKVLQGISVWKSRTYVELECLSVYIVNSFHGLLISSAVFCAFHVCIVNSNWFSYLNKSF